MKDDTKPNQVEPRLEIKKDKENCVHLDSHQLCV